MADYDAVIIGTGQAGPGLARRLVAAGWKVAIIERKFFGGTCINTGCTPTKTLIASGYAAHLTRRAAEFGVILSGTPGVDMKAVKARKDAVTAASRAAVERSLKELQGCAVYEAHAMFIGPKQIKIADEVLRADKIFINVGGRAVIPSIPGLDEVPYLTNSSMMNVDFLPAHLIVLGGSYVGLEFAQLYRRFGSDVTVIEPSPRLISREDEDISHAIADILQAEDIDIRVNSKAVGVKKQGAGIAVTIEGAGTRSQVDGSHLLLAVGRRPNTSVPGIWALGDCNGRGAFTHTSYNDFEIVAANLLDNDQRRVTDRITAYALYIDPPLGRAGMTEAEVRKSGRPALIATMPMENVSRAYEKSETKGFMKILVDRETKEILGASLLGLSGDEVIHCILDTMYAKAPSTVLQRAMHIHPTVSEFVPTMLDDLVPLQ
jgi:pyruvate/2-oxoglutarate dehydrogenase complex dihydrolipoamide dehydrogenase (E3) component